MVKPELLALVKENLPQQKYVIDEMAKPSKKTVLSYNSYLPLAISPLFMARIKQNKNMNKSL
jgi:hypothetical protein